MPNHLTDGELGDAILGHLPDPVAVLGPGAELLWANPAAEARFGWKLDEVQGQSLAGLVHPDDLPTALLSLASVSTKEVGSLVEIRLRDATDRYAWFEVRGSGWEAAPTPGTVVIVLRESTDRRRWELGQGDHQMLGAVLDVAPTISMVLDVDGTIRGANRALTRHLHCPLDGTLGRPLLDLIAPDDRCIVQSELDSLSGTGHTRRFEVRMWASEGPMIPMSMTVVDLAADDAVQGYVVAASDITSLVQVRSELRHLANHDGLTGLPNRSHLREWLRGLLASTEPGVQHALIFGDLDDFKPVNDRWGHQAGDAVLAEIARRLASVMRAGDFVARIHGDEFVVVLPTADERVIEEVKERIAGALAEPVTLPNGHLVPVSMSTGIATTDGSIDVDDLLASADAAMYVAKRARG